MLGLERQCGQVHFWHTAILRKEEMIIPFANKNLVEGQWCCVFLAFIIGTSGVSV